MKRQYTHAVVYSPLNCVHVQLVQDVSPNSWSGGGCQCHDGHPWEVLAELTQSLVVWAEVVTPLTNTMGLINHKPCQPITGIQPLQCGLKFIAGSKL